MINDIEYIVAQNEFTKNFEVKKLVNGQYYCTYIIEKSINDRLICSCASGVYRKYCKHVTWIRDMVREYELPKNVLFEKRITGEDIISLFCNKLAYV